MFFHFFILDVLDELLYEMDFNENYVVVKINLTSVDNAIATLGSFNGIKGIAGGDIAALDLDAVKLYHLIKYRCFNVL